jgi:hypothetical protein
VNIVLQGGRPAAGTCAAQWTALSPRKQAGLDHGGFDAGCNGASAPDAATGPSPVTTP